MMKNLRFVKIKGMGCKDSSKLESSIVKTSEEDQAGRRRRRRRRRRLGTSSSNHHHSANDSRNNNKKKLKKKNVVVDVPDVCCTPPGIGIASDFAPRNPRNIILPAPAPAPAAARLDHRKHPRESRRNGDDVPVSRTNHRSAEETIRMLMAQQTLLYHRIIDRHHNWRLNVDDMSYEELLDLSNKIGYVGTGLQEREISTCLRRFKNVTSDCHKDWKCSICQEKCRRDDEIGRLECGHYHHVQCIKQWLLQKNQCPVCKSVAILK